MSLINFNFKKVDAIKYVTAVFLVLQVSGTIAIASDRSSIRSVDSDAANTLAIFLDVSGCNVSRDSIIAALRNSDTINFHQMCDVTKNKSLNSRLARFGASDILTLPIPSIVFFEGEASHSGTFNLLVDRDTSLETLTVLSGGLLEFQTHSFDEFSRIWSGHALFRVQEDSLWHVSLGLVGLVFMLIFAAHFFLSTWISRTRLQGVVAIQHLHAERYSVSSFPDRKKFLALSLLIAGGNDSVCHAETLPAVVVEQLQQNAEAVNHLSVRYAITRRSEIPLPEVLSRIKKPTAVEFFQPNQYELTFQGNKWRTSTAIWMTVDNRTFQSRNLNVFDGDLKYGTNLAEDSPVVNISDRGHFESKTPLKNSVGYCYFLVYNGFIVPEKSVSTWYPLESSIDYKMKSDPSQVSVKRESDMVWRVTFPGDDITETFFLDETKNSAVIRRENYDSRGRLLSKTVNSDFVNISGTVLWLPKRCTTDYFSWLSIPDQVFDDVLLTGDLDVSSYSREPLPEDSFVIDWKKPGTHVGDSRLPGSADTPGGYVSFRVPANIEDIDKAILAAMKGEEFQRITPSVKRSVSFVWLTIGAIIAMLLFSARRFVSK